jgi:tryptophanyl-tRNA synthetase
MRVLSGIQPTGNLHLGNYLGAIRNWVKMQDEMDSASQCFFFLADMHSITVHDGAGTAPAERPRDGGGTGRLRHRPGAQRAVQPGAGPAHAELCWLLNGTARMGWLNRMTQFKDKAGKNREGVSIGLYVYPVLQAADVLLYQATHVPVGEDQKQHLELTRDIARSSTPTFEREVGRAGFTLPDPIIPQGAARIMSLRDGSAKMSKSDPSDMSRINLTDDADAMPRRCVRPRPTLSRCRPKRRGWKVARRRSISSASMRRWPARARIRCAPNSPGKASARSSPLWRTCWSAAFIPSASATSP